MCSFPSYEELSQHWHSKILVDLKPTFENGSDTINGMYADPVEFLPKHMARWLERKEFERSPIPPGYYHVKFKVLFSFPLISFSGKKWKDCYNLRKIEKMHILLLQGDPFQLLE